MTWPGSSRSRLVLVGAGFAFLIAQNLLWVRRTLLPAPPPWDPALYLFMGLRYWHALTGQGLAALWREIQDLSLVPYVPPLFPLSALPLYAAFGESRLAAYATSSLYLCALLLGIYLLARERHGEGALALFLAATCSAPITLSRDYHTDLPAAAFTTLAVWFLLRSDGFRHLAGSAAFGAFAGLALLTKTMAGPFFVAPALWALARSWRRRDERRDVLRNAGLALAATGLVAWTWWGSHAERAVSYLLYYGWGAGADPYVPAGVGGVLGSRSLVFYLAALANQGASVPYALLMVVLLVAGARRRLRPGRDAAPADLASGVLWAWLLAGYLLLTLSRNKTADRYVIFLVAPVAALMAGALAALPRGGWRRAALAAAVLMGVANYAALTWPGAGVPLLHWSPPFGLKAYEPGQAWLRSEQPVPEHGWPLPAIVDALSRATGPTKAGLLPALLAEEPAAGSPEDQVRAAYWRLLRREPDPTGLSSYARELRVGTKTPAELLRELAASGEFADRPLRVLVVPDHPFLNASTLRYYAEAARVRVTFARVEPGHAGPLTLEDYDALLVKDGGYQGPAFSTTHVRWVEARLRQDEAGFGRPPLAFPCPDESRASVWLFGAEGPSTGPLSY
jgi:hypothetical protein